MWLLHWLPDWVFHAILVVGILGLMATWFLKFIPIIDKYVLPIQLIALVLTVGGVWYEGGIYNDKTWREKVTELEKKVEVAEAKSAKTNTVIETKVVTKIVKVKENTDANIKYITQYIAKDLDADCRLTTASVVQHNRASQNEVPGSAGDTTKGTSDVKASELLTTVTENYGTYYQVVEQLKGWQEWYKEQKRIFESVK